MALVAVAARDAVAVVRRVAVGEAVAVGTPVAVGTAVAVCVGVPVGTLASSLKSSSTDTPLMDRSSTTVVFVALATLALATGSAAVMWAVLVRGPLSRAHRPCSVTCVVCGTVGWA